jgi:glyceraldehyde-3-phosphate dehydrogenase (NAD(P))
MRGVAFWEDVLAVQGREAFYTYQVFNEAIVVPETIDAVRALTGHVRDGAKAGWLAFSLGRIRGRGR